MLKFWIDKKVLLFYSIFWRNLIGKGLGVAIFLIFEIIFDVDIAVFLFFETAVCVFWKNLFNLLFFTISCWILLVSRLFFPSPNTLHFCFRFIRDLLEIFFGFFLQNLGFESLILKIIIRRLIGVIGRKRAFRGVFSSLKWDFCVKSEIIFPSRSHLIAAIGLNRKFLLAIFFCFIFQFRIFLHNRFVVRSCAMLNLAIRKAVMVLRLDFLLRGFLWLKFFELFLLNCLFF
jgi:hypothetical protein